MAIMQTDHCELDEAAGAQQLDAKTNPMGAHLLSVVPAAELADLLEGVDMTLLHRSSVLLLQVAL